MDRGGDLPASPGTVPPKSTEPMAHRAQTAGDGRSLVATAFSPSTTYGSTFPRRSKNPNAPRASADPRLVQDCFAGCEAQHQQTAFAKKKQHDAVFFVKPTRRDFCRPGGASPFDANTCAAASRYGASSCVTIAFSSRSSPWPVTALTAMTSRPICAESASRISSVPGSSALLTITISGRLPKRSS